MKALRLVFITSLTTAGLWSGQVNGSWIAEVAGRQGSIIAIRMELKEADGAVTGKIRDSYGDETISGGTIDGNLVTFTVVTEFRGEQIRQRYRGTVDGDVIHFQVIAEGGENADLPIREFEAERTSADSPSDTEDQNI
jgi:hypothetical protein